MLTADELVERAGPDLRIRCELKPPVVDGCGLKFATCVGVIRRSRVAGSRTAPVARR
jgi:hypothetical protein